MENNLETDLGEIELSINDTIYQSSQNFKQLAVILKQQHSEIKKLKTAKKRMTTTHQKSKRQDDAQSKAALDDLRKTNELRTTRQNERHQSDKAKSQRQIDAYRKRVDLYESDMLQLYSQLDKASEKLDQFLCTICHHRQVDVIITCCRHIYCGKCVAEWRRQIDARRNVELDFSDDDHAEHVQRYSCPNCRTEFKEEDVRPLHFA